MAAHALRNPLSAIRMASATLKHPKADAEVRAAQHEVIQRQTAHMARLIDDLLDVSRIITGKFNNWIDDFAWRGDSKGDVELGAKYAVEPIPADLVACTLAAEDKPSNEGHAMPMEVMDTPFRSADLTHGYQAVADNLPNDPRVHEKKGSKKLFFKNFMDARVNYVIIPVARQMLRTDQAAKVSGDGYLLGTIMHEIAHGLGPAFARTATGKMSIRESVGPIFSGLEEAKADVTGMFGLKWLVDHGALPRERPEEYYASYVAGIFRTVRFGIAEAHGRAEMMEFNFLSERGAITRNADGRYAIDYARMPDAIAAVTKELLEIEATGDRARAESWFARYEKMPADLTAALEASRDVPVDFDPVSAFPEGVD